MQYQYQTSVVIMERGWQQPISSAAEMSSPNCPRCGSSNTKFCYYNNYSLTQPRYFCKGCRRYWTKGGNLRNVPVGGGCRKNRRAGKSLRLSTQLLSHRNNNTNTRASEPLGRYSPGAGDSSSSSGQPDPGSHIDLALVYANFLNNNPQQQPEESNKVKGSEEAQVDNNSISPNNNIQMLDQGSNDDSSSIGFFGWDSLSDLFADSDHLKVAESGFESRDVVSNNGQQIYNHGGVVVDLLHNNMHHHHHAPTTNDFELPPLPGEGVGGCREITMAAAATWSDSGHQLLEDHHSLAVTELLPIINGPADDHQLAATADHDLNLIGTTNTKDQFDFDGDNTFLRK